nr:reverse transcriptase domain-containing protein [Tanacetum cinerariifolium]
MANTTPIVTTVMKTTNKEKTPKEADAALKANILDFCEEHYEDILPVIMDKIRRDKRKEVHAILDFGENPKKSRRMREGSQNSSAGTLPAGYRDLSERPKILDRLKYNDEDTVKEMMTATTAFIRGEIAAASKKKVHTLWKSQDQSKRQTSEQRSDFRNQPKDGRGSNKFTSLTRTPKEIFAAESGKFKPPPPMRVTRQKVIQSFTHVKEITFPPLTANKGTRGPLVIEAKIGGHAVHRIYVDEGSSMEYHPRLTECSFSVNGGIVIIRSTILMSTECATIAATPKDPAKKAEARHENFKVAINSDFPNQDITIRGAVSTKARTELCTLLKGNLDIFVRRPSDMTGVPRAIAEHQLDIREGYSLVRQKNEAGPGAR